MILLTRKTERQLSRGKGRETPTDVTLAQRMFLSTRSEAENDAFMGREVVAGMLKIEFCVIVVLEREATEG